MIVQFVVPACVVRWVVGDVSHVATAVPTAWCAVGHPLHKNTTNWTPYLRIVLLDNWGLCVVARTLFSHGASLGFMGKSANFA